jgi:hypothetical protein
MSLPYLIANGLMSYHVDTSPNVLEKNLSALPSPHHRSSIFFHFVSVRCHAISLRCDPNEGTYGAFLKAMNNGNRSSITNRMLSQKIINTIEYKKINLSM